MYRVAAEMLIAVTSTIVMTIVVLFLGTVSAQPLALPDDWPIQGARECVEACKVPVLYIEAAHRLADLARLATLCPQLVTAKAVGSGHFLSLAVPEQINPMIDRFMSLYVRRSL